jgi:hypothetical protein
MHSNHRAAPAGADPCGLWPAMTMFASDPRPAGMEEPV